MFHPKKTTGIRATGLVAIILLLALQHVRSAQVQIAPAADLRNLFAAGGLLQDTNGDGVIDDVNARIVLGSPASASDVSAAANVAARLGFETSAMNIPLGEGSGRIPIAIGSAGVKAAGIQTPVPALTAGEGLVASIEANGVSGVMVAGGDDAGTRAAAEWLSGRLPHIWDPNGPTIDAVADEVRAFLTGASIAAAVRVPAVRVRAGEDRLERLDVAVTLRSAADAAR